MNACQHPIVILKDVRYKDLKTLVEYMYYGEVNVCEDQLPAILKVYFLHALCIQLSLGGRDILKKNSKKGRYQGQCIKYDTLEMTGSKAVIFNS